MASILDLLGGHLTPDTMNQMGSQLGLGQDQLAKALPSAIAVLTGGLARNAQQEGGASALAAALDRDHDGSLLDDVAGYLGNPAAGNGAGILRHVLGGEASNAEVALGRASGIDAGQAGNLLKMLAPMLLGALGKAKRQNNFGAADLGNMLGREGRQMKSAMPSGLGGLAASFLDSDGDGDIKDDMMRMGAGLLGKMFKGR